MKAKAKTAAGQPEGEDVQNLVLSRLYHALNAEITLWYREDPASPNNQIYQYLRFAREAAHDLMNQSQGLAPETAPAARGRLFEKDSSRDISIEDRFSALIKGIQSELDKDQINNPFLIQLVWTSQKVTVSSPAVSHEAELKSICDMINREYKKYGLSSADEAALRKAIQTINFGKGSFVDRNQCLKQAVEKCNQPSAKKTGELFQPLSVKKVLESWVDQLKDLEDKALKSLKSFDSKPPTSGGS